MSSCTEITNRWKVGCSSQKVGEDLGEGVVLYENKDKEERNGPRRVKKRRETLLHDFFTTYSYT